MKRGKFEIRIGTSGWHYQHWIKRFYPEKLPKSNWLEFYTKTFDTVELNNTFYRLPKKTAVENWYRQSPDNFLFVVKASRYITHIKKLKDVSQELKFFYETISPLKNKLGPILFQVPPSFRINLERLESFLKLIPKTKISVFEFRNDSWYTQETYELLKKYKISFCMHDFGGSETERVITGPVIYFRFHGASGPYAGSYPTSILKDYAKWIKKNSKNAQAAFVYFNNDYNAYAVDNAKELLELLK